MKGVRARLRELNFRDKMYRRAVPPPLPRRKIFHVDTDNFSPSAYCRGAAARPDHRQKAREHMKGFRDGQYRKKKTRRVFRTAFVSRATTRVFVFGRSRRNAQIARSGGNVREDLPNDVYVNLVPFCRGLASLFVLLSPLSMRDSRLSGLAGNTTLSISV